MAVPLSVTEDLELELLLEAVHRRYGFDFRDYAAASLRRRLARRAAAEGAGTYSELQGLLLRDAECMERLLRDLSINVTAMFRDPPFFRALRDHVVPLLRTYPFTRIWCAGCSTGEEVWSLAILLYEEGLYDRARIYATDINEHNVEVARLGIFPLDRMRAYTQSYIRAGGTQHFSDYYVAAYDAARFDPRLAENIVFAQHNLATDGSFNEFAVILCRNVLIYFDTALQHRVSELFDESLCRLGVLGLGRKDSLAFTPVADRYASLDAEERIYRKVA